MKIAGKDPNGNAKGVAVTENGEVKVQQTGSIVPVYHNVEALSAIADRKEQTLFEYNNYLNVDYLEIATDYIDMVFRIYTKVNGTYERISIKRANNTDTVATPRYISGLGGGLFDVIQFDTKNNHYKFVFTERLKTFPEGFKITYQNRDSTEHNISILLIGRG